MYWHKNGKGFSLQIKNTSNQNFTIKYLLSIPLDKTLQKKTAVQVRTYHLFKADSTKCYKT